MKIEDDWVNRFLDHENGFYQFSLRLKKYDGSYEFFDDDRWFTSYPECLEAVKQSVEEYDDQDLRYLKIRIRRRDKNHINDTSYIEVYLNADYEISEIYDNGCDIEESEIYGFFDEMWFDFPTPFKKGDVIFDCTAGSFAYGQEPVVLEKTSVEYYKEKNKRGCDTSDMWLSGYFLNKSQGIIYWEQALHYMNFEYYPIDQLVEGKKVLKAISAYLKNKIDLSTLLNMYHQVVSEESVKHIVHNGEWERVDV